MTDHGRKGTEHVSVPASEGFSSSGGRAIVITTSLAFYNFQKNFLQIPSSCISLWNKSIEPTWEIWGRSHCGCLRDFTGDRPNLGDASDVGTLPIAKNRPGSTAGNGKISPKLMPGLGSWLGMEHLSKIDGSYGIVSPKCKYECRWQYSIGGCQEAGWIQKGTCQKQEERLWMRRAVVHVDSLHAPFHLNFHKERQVWQGH